MIISQDLGKLRKLSDSFEKLSFADERKFIILLEKFLIFFTPYKILNYFHACN